MKNDKLHIKILSVKDKCDKVTNEEKTTDQAQTPLNMKYRFSKPYKSNIIKYQLEEPWEKLN